MSDLDSLIVTFQTQLSDVMEAVVKTAMFEVTRLVEDVFLVEVKRRDQEVESLRMQLQWSDDGGKRRCVDVDHRTDTLEERAEDAQGDLIQGCDATKQGDSVEPWMTSHKHEGNTRSPEDVAATQSPERESQATEEEDGIPAIDMKEEEVHKPSCSSVQMRGWSSTLDSEAGPESDNTSEAVAAESSEELLKNVIKPDPALYADQPHLSSLELDSPWAGLPVPAAGLQQNHRLGAEKECDPVKAKGSLQLADHVPSSGSPKARLQPSNVLGVTVKEEVIDSDSCDESEETEKKLNKAKAASFSVRQQRASSGAHKPQHVYHKTTVQEVTKLQSKAGAGLRLQAAIQHLHRPMRKPTHTLPSSPSAALSVAHTQAVNLNNLNRIPCTSKSVAPPSQSAQRLHLDDKPASTRSQSGASWVSTKSQHPSANSLHPAPHADSQSYSGSRHLLRCGQCGKCFPHPSNLKTHLQTHTGERPFCCSLCGRSFTKLSNLKAHRRVHTGERPYCCLACGKRFTQKCNLKRHQRIHLDV